LGAPSKRFTVVSLRELMLPARRSPPAEAGGSPVARKNAFSCIGAEAPAQQRTTQAARRSRFFPPLTYVFSVLSQGVMCPNHKASRRLASPVAGDRSEAETTGKHGHYPTQHPGRGARNQGTAPPSGIPSGCKRVRKNAASRGSDDPRLGSCDACGVGPPAASWLNTYKLAARRLQEKTLFLASVRKHRRNSARRKPHAEAGFSHDPRPPRTDARTLLRGLTPAARQASTPSCPPRVEAPGPRRFSALRALWPLRAYPKNPCVLGNSEARTIFRIGS